LLGVSSGKSNPSNRSVFKFGSNYAAIIIGLSKEEEEKVIVPIRLNNFMA
jgi:hypothetical protein